ncbi:MAG: L,D-transpeptidase family protein [Chloroflexota bacterium]|nr:L,D-transpeptidase family protein [Chloroflexota bacterium]
MINDPDQPLIAEAKAALRRGDRTLSRRIAQKYVKEHPDNVEGWLLLGGLSDPTGSLAYIQKAQNIAPDDPRVNEALEWAQERCIDAQAATSSEQTQTIHHIPSHSTLKVEPPVVVESHHPVWVWTFVVLLVLTLVFLGLDLLPNHFVRAAEKAMLIDQEDLTKPSLTPTFTNTPTPTQTPTSTPIHTLTSTSTPTAIRTTQPPTSTLMPTQSEPPSPPDDIDDDDRWIDIDLSDQRLYAYEGQTNVRSFVVSTGTWDHPTPVGSYNVWIKLRYAAMSGPGYYWPDVPYTMYFYSGYGIHGAYWHNNFGTPMSYGCVNMITEEAGWLYDWSYVGIPVIVHE